MSALALPGVRGLGPRQRAIAWCLVSLVLLGVGANAVRRALRGRGSRYDENVTFSRDLVYRDVNVYEVHPAQATHTKYPPFYFVYCAPFVPLPTGLGASLWFLLGLAMAWATIVMAVRLAWPASSPRAPPRTAFYLLAGVMAWIVVNNLSTSQVNIQIGFFVVLGLYWIRSGREQLGGMALVVATMLKVTPALLLVWLLVRRRWLALRGAAVAFLAVAALTALVLGPDLLVDATRAWMDVMLAFVREGVLGEGVGGIRHTNQSLAAACFRFFTDSPAGAGIEGFRVNVLSLSYDTMGVVVRVLNVVLLLAVGWILGRGPVAVDSPRFAREAALLMVLTLVISPITWMNHHVALILPYALCLQAWREAEPPNRRRYQHWIGIAVLLMLTSVWIVLMAFSLPLLGALLVGALLVRLLRPGAA